MKNHSRSLRTRFSVLLVLSIFMLATAPAFANQAIDANGPRLKVDGFIEIRGEIQSGDPGTLSVRVKNMDDQMLTIGTASISPNPKEGKIELFPAMDACANTIIAAFGEARCMVKDTFVRDTTYTLKWINIMRADDAEATEVRIEVTAKGSTILQAIGDFLGGIGKGLSEMIAGKSSANADEEAESLQTDTAAVSGADSDEASATSASSKSVSPFSGKGYGVPLTISIPDTQLAIDRIGQVKEQGGLEIKGRVYEAEGLFPVEINDVEYMATEIKIVSNLKLKNSIGEHQGTIDIDVDTNPIGHMTLEYKGTASADGNEIVSGGAFKTVRTTGVFAGLVSDGTYTLKIEEAGSSAIVKFAATGGTVAATGSESGQRGPDTSGQAIQGAGTGSSNGQSTSNPSSTSDSDSGSTADSSSSSMSGSTSGQSSSSSGQTGSLDSSSSAQTQPQSQQQSQNTNQFKGDGISASFSEGKDKAEIRIKNEGTSAITVISVDVSGPQKVTVKNCIGEIAPKKELRCTALGNLDPNDEHKATVSIKMPDGAIKRIVLVA